MSVQVSRALLPQAALAALFLMVQPARAEYRLGPGDTLEISVFGSADYKRRVVVDVDGDVSLPFLGEVPAAGHGISDLRKTVDERLRHTGTMTDPDVTVEIVEYRPFFISGDVARPGAVPFRPGTTVRTAVALAGGFDALRFRADNPLLSGPGYRSEYDSLWAELLRQQARELTLRAERSGAAVVDLSSLAAAPVARGVANRIAELERSDFAFRLAAAARDKAFLQTSLKRTDADIANERSTVAKQADAIDVQLQTGARLRDAQARGIVSGFRTAEDSRDLSQLRSAQDQSLSRLADLLRTRDELAKHLAAFDDERQARIGRELQDVVVGIEKTRSQIRSASERLIYTNALKAQLRTGQGPDIVIHRHNGDKSATLDATEDTAVQPDDVVEVVIRPDQLVVSPTQ